MYLIAVKAAADIVSGKIKLGKKKSITGKLTTMLFYVIIYSNVATKSIIYVTFLTDRVTDFAFSTNFVKNKVFETAKGKVMKQTKGLYPAPLRILDVVRTGLDKGAVAGYAAEAKAFGELAMTPEARGLISLFHGQTECKKNAFGEPKRPAK